jgi:hemerythrin-like domain-containing protein
MMVACARQRPSTVLKQEHQVILRVLGVLENLADRSESGTFESESLHRCVEFSQLFADACHHAKEETELFPVLEARGVPREGGPIGVMLYEHGVARTLIERMHDILQRRAETEDSALDADFRETARAYIHLMRQHIHKEDNVLFQIGDQVMTEADQEMLGERFCDVACRTFGGKRTEELETLADELETLWGAAA